MMPIHDLVDSHAWRNRYVGIEHGAYDYRLRWHRARMVGNPVGFHAFANATLLQDAEIIGRGLSAGPNTVVTGAAKEDVGIKLANNSRLPFEPHRFQRVDIRDLASGFQGLGVGVFWPGQSTRIYCHPPYTPVVTATITFPGEECATGWTRLAGMTFGPGIRPRAYVNTLNPNDALFDFDLGAVFLRPDQNPATGEASQRLVVSGVTTYDAAVDAVKTPLSVLPAALEFIGSVNLRGHKYTFTAPLAHDDPPEVQLGLSLVGRLATLTATTSGDTVKVEYFVDEMKVGETTTQHQIVVDLSNHSRRYAYVYARALDGVTADAGCVDYVYQGQVYNSRCEPGYAQRGYSSVIEIGPEALKAPPTLESLQDQIDQLRALLLACQAGQP